MGLDEFETRWNNQNGKCKICSREMERTPGTGSSVVVDHCHTSGIVRGLLCNECNRGLGYFKDNPKTLKQAATYLEDYLAFSN